MLDTMDIWINYTSDIEIGPVTTFTISLFHPPVSRTLKVFSRRNPIQTNWSVLSWIGEFE